MQPSFDLLMIYQQDGYDVSLWSCLCCLSMNLYFDHSMTSTYPSTYLSRYDISTAEAEARFESLIIGISVSYFKSSLFDSKCWEENPECPEAPQTSLRGFLGTLFNSAVVGRIESMASVQTPPCEDPTLSSCCELGTNLKGCCHLNPLRGKECPALIPSVSATCCSPV